MPERIRRMLGALERFLDRVIRTQFDELVFVTAFILLLMGLCLAGLWAAGRVGILVAGCLGMIPFGVCTFVLLRRPPLRNSKEVRQRMPGDFVRQGILFLALYAFGFVGAEFYPALHPVHGEMWFLFSFCFAVSPGCIIVGLAGHVDPRICFALGSATRDLTIPWRIRAAGRALLWGGFALGGGAMYCVHHAAA